MLNDIFQKAMGFLQKPAKAYDKEKGTDVFEAFKYMAILFLVVSVLTAVISLQPLTFVLVYVYGIVSTVIAGLWLHLWAYIFGAKRGLHQTLKTVFYGGTPNYLLGWIPYIGILFWLWTLYLNWTGLQRLHGMPGDRATFSILVAFVVPMAIMVILALMALSFFMPFMAEYSASQGFPMLQ
jgi:hypothetical protein